MKMIEEKVIPAVLKKCPWAKKVIIQIDSAGGHRIKESVDYLNGLGKKTKVPIDVYHSALPLPRHKRFGLRDLELHEVSRNRTKI